MTCDYSKYKIAFIGGDQRAVYAAQRLAGKGIESALFGFDQYKGDIGLCTKCDTVEDAATLADILVLPIPMTCDGITVCAPFCSKSLLLDEVLKSVSGDTAVLYGGGCFKIEKHVALRDKDVFNYAARIDFQTANAVPTAEAALEIALREKPVTLCGQTALVVGYGRIGKVLCRLLCAFGVQVYASARKSEDLIFAETNGCKPIKTDRIGEVIGKCSLIFNTVPKPVINADVLSHVRKDALLIDLASKPGGVDFAAAKNAGIKTLWALGLPGKVFPVSAGSILADTVLTILEERGNKKC